MVGKKVASKGKKNGKTSSKVHKKQGETIGTHLPTTIKVIIGYCMVLAVLYLAYFVIGLYVPATLFFGKLIEGYTALAVDLFILGVLSFVIYGLYKGEKWGYNLTIGWFIFGIFNSLISAMAITPGFIKDLIFVSFIGITLINGLMIWYLIAHRKFYYQKTFTHKLTEKDKFFIYSLVSVWTIIIILVMILGSNFYHKTTQKADFFIDELTGVSKLHGTVICDIKEVPEDRDMCFVVLATVYGGEDIKFICDRIESSFYRFICERV